jgi:hypothetical protein
MGANRDRVYPSVSGQVTDYKVISTSILPVLTEVRLYDETIKHVEEEHQIPAKLPCIQTAMENAISNPTQIERSYGNSFVYMDAATTNASGDPLRIPVKHVEGTSGRIKTFYFADPPTGADVIYRRGT